MADTSGISRPAVLRLTLPCDLRQVRSTAQMVRRFSATDQEDEETLAACDLALVEGCNNAIQYAPAEARHQPVQVEVVRSPGEIEIRITDHTPGFDWPGRMGLPDPEAERGRGLYLIQALMDGADYLRGSGQNVLVLRKARAVPALPLASALPQELEIARKVQHSLLLEESPCLPGYALAAFCQGAQQVSGDYHDVLRISDDMALLVIADVMGKGIMAAMFAAILRTVLRAMPELACRPAALLSRLNHLLFEELSRADMFITAQTVCLDARERQLTVASAGHCPLLAAGRNGAGVRTCSPEGMPLGILPDTLFLEEIVKLPEQSRVLLYTDGVTDAANPAGDRYGQERLMEWLAQAANRPVTAEQLKRELADTLAGFRTDAGLSDDQTFLVIASE